MALAFVNFGSSDENLYALYLLSQLTEQQVDFGRSLSGLRDGARVQLLLDRSSVHACTMGGSCGTDGDREFGSDGACGHSVGVGQSGTCGSCGGTGGCLHLAGSGLVGPSGGKNGGTGSRAVGVGGDLAQGHSEVQGDVRASERGSSSVAEGEGRFPCASELGGTCKSKAQLSKEKRARYKANKKQRALGKAVGVPEWRRGAAPPSQGRKGSFDDCDEVVKKQLVESRAERFVAENKLAIRKAEQALQLAESTDMEQLVKCQRVKLVKATEQSMVAIEKAHGTLKATGNVPGYAETLVSSMPSMTSGESITPDSSVSAKEVHAMNKALKDLTKEVEDVKAENQRLMRILDSAGIDPKLAKPDKEFWTVNSDGEFVDKEAVDYNFPDGYAMETTSEPDRDGKTRFRIVF